MLDANVGGLLAKAFATGTAAHAYIVVGEKQYLPELLAECALVAMCKTHTGYDGCEACVKVKHSSHQDVVLVPLDKQKNRLTVADAAYVVEEIYKRPADKSDSRVFLINAADSVTGVGCEIWQNKLLKTLEEPTDGAYVFIGVTDAESLLPTVRSRCQILKQSVMSVADVKSALVSKGFDARSAEMVAAMSGGSLNFAERLMSNPQTFKAYQTALDAAQNMTSTKSAVNYACAVVSNKDYVNDFLGFYALLLRESIVYRLQEELCQLPSFTAEMDKICANYTFDGAASCILRLNQAKRRLDSNANVSVTVDLLLNNILQIRYLTRD